MNPPTLSQLTSIATKAMEDAVRLSREMVCGVPRGMEYPVARYAVTAVLDAVGYKFPVDPEREAFERWLARQSSDDKPDLFTVWQAGKASRTTTEPATPETPETFEAHGYTWFRHTPGDPCPCDPGAKIFIACKDGIKRERAVSPTDCRWSKANTADIIGWRYAS